VGPMMRKSITDVAFCQHAVIIGPHSGHYCPPPGVARVPLSDESEAFGHHQCCVQATRPIIPHTRHDWRKSYNRYDR
jgi:hypothetical protein